MSMYIMFPTAAVAIRVLNSVCNVFYVFLYAACVTFVVDMLTCMVIGDVGLYLHVIPGIDG